MIIKNCNNEIEWVDKINSWLETQVSIHKAQSLFLPAGETPRALYKDWEARRPKFLQKLKLMQVDDVLRSPGSQGRMFEAFFKETLPSYQNQMVYINEADTLADLTLLGLGTNGHVAFHEPKMPAHFYSGCLPLDKETTERLNLPIGTYGVSYGLGAFMRTKAIALIVRGESKRPILSEILSEECTLPAAQLKRHKDFSVFVL